MVGIGADGWSGLGDASRQALRAAVVILGSGRQLGLLPDDVRAERVPLPSPLRPALPALLEAHAGRGLAVLASGELMAADLVIIGVGIEPTTELAEAAGLAVDDGILIDAHVRSNDPTIVAAGDCASQDMPRYGRRIRLEQGPREAAGVGNGWEVLPPQDP